MLWLFLLFLAVGAYFLFRDTLNRIQYIETIRLYWITKDDGKEVAAYQPRIMRSFMRQTAAPFWNGNGVQFRFHRWTFQVGILTHKSDSLEYQVGRNGWLDIPPRDLHKFGAKDEDSQSS
jgi:hypothetical protein